MARLLPRLRPSLPPPRRSLLRLPPSRPLPRRSRLPLLLPRRLSRLRSRLPRSRSTKQTPTTAAAAAMMQILNSLLSSDASQWMRAQLLVCAPLQRIQPTVSAFSLQLVAPRRLSLACCVEIIVCATPAIQFFTCKPCIPDSCERFARSVPRGGVDARVCVDRDRRGADCKRFTGSTRQKLERCRVCTLTEYIEQVQRMRARRRCENSCSRRRRCRRAAR